MSGLEMRLAADRELVARVLAMRRTLGRWPTAADAVTLDPSLLGLACDGGYLMDELVLDVRRLQGERVGALSEAGGNALVLGGASCVWGDVRRSEEMFGAEWWDTVVAVNDIGVHWPRRLDHWASLHPQKFKDDPDHPSRWGWLQQREKNGHPGGYVTCAKRQPADVIIRSWGGDSGLLGVCRAYHLGCSRVVIAGIPMDPTPHFEESTVHVPGQKWTSCHSHWKVWHRKLNLIRERTRSMSGRTMEELGEPDAAWLGRMAGDTAADVHSAVA